MTKPPYGTWVVQEVDQAMVDRLAAAHTADPLAVELGVDLVADPNREEDEGYVWTRLHTHLATFLAAGRSGLEREAERMYTVCTEVMVMASPASRLNFRISAEAEARLRAAADASQQTLTEFVLGAAEERADEVLASRTVIPAEYFDQLLAALDAPPEPMPALARAAKRQRRFVQR